MRAKRSLALIGLALAMGCVSPSPPGSEDGEETGGESTTTQSTGGTSTGESGTETETTGGGTDTGGTETGGTDTGETDTGATDTGETDTGGPQECGGPPFPAEYDEEAPEGGAVSMGCADPGGFGSPVEFAATPREDPRMEALAIELDETFIATQSSYDRLVEDVYAIRCEHPEVEHIDYFWWVPDRLSLSLDDATHQLVKDGEYDAWDCLNAWYGFRVDLVGNNAAFVVLSAAGTFDEAKLKSSYEALPGVTAASPNGPAGDGSSICVTADGQTRHYVFEDRWGDCPSGCIWEHDYYFTTDSPGQVVFHGEWSSDSNDPAPDWVGSYGC
jgi:hypothetical protein